jgi:predicted DNA-binding transcriptional regulator AlpA
MEKDESMNQEILLNPAEVSAMLKISRKTFEYFLRKEDNMSFPKPITFGPRMRRWRLSDIEEWINSARDK